MTHSVPPGSYETTLTVIKMSSGVVETERASVKSTAAVTIPQLGSFYELHDDIYNKELKGIVTKVSHKNSIAPGPVFIGSVEEILE